MTGRPVRVAIAVRWGRKVAAAASALCLVMTSSTGALAASTPAPPVPAPTRPQPAPAPAPPPVVWVQSFAPTYLWSNPQADAVQFAAVEAWRYFRVTGAQQEGRIPVVDPRTNGPAWIDAASVGPAPAPADPTKVNPPAGWVPPVVVPPVPTAWLGVVRGGGAEVYAAPSTAAPVVDELEEGAPVEVEDWVPGPWVSGPPSTVDNYTWAMLGDGQYVPSRMLRPRDLEDDRSPLPPDASFEGHWAEVNTTTGVLTLYDGDTPVLASYASWGRPGPADFETHPGVHHIWRRVYSERMRGPGYDVSGVLFTQYFGHWPSGDLDYEAIHMNNWTPDDQFGIPLSHGCVGLPYDDALFAWSFLTLGDVVYVHS